MADVDPYSPPQTDMVPAVMTFNLTVSGDLHVELNAREFHDSTGVELENASADDIWDWLSERDPDLEQEIEWDSLNWEDPFIDIHFLAHLRDLVNNNPEDF